MAIKVLVVDDSAFMRKVITEILEQQPDIQVVATARNGQDALEKLQKLDVDVVTLDLEMPVLDGLSTLKEIMNSNPLPVILLSSMTQRGSEITMKALSLGAVDFIPKPSGAISLDLHTVSEELITKVRSVAGIQVKKPIATEPKKISISPTVSTRKPVSVKPGEISDNLVVIGSSTGGPRALEEIFLSLPENINAGIVVVQHMPKGFTHSFAERLNSISSVHVKEAEEGDYIKNGHALIAPGDYHLVIDSQKQIRLNQSAPVQYLRPAVDVTMLHLPNVFKSNIIGVILTGMGRDGAEGMARIKQLGGFTIAQDRATSTIYSMPKAVIESGNADYILPLDSIADCIVRLLGNM